MTDISPLPTRTAGLERLAEFLPAAGKRYREGRNFDFGGMGGSKTSVLSPYIRHRLISEHEISQHVLEKYGLQGSEKFIQEVFWRTYFKGWLEQRPEVWRDYVDGRDHWLSQLEEDDTLQADYEAAISGRAGADGFDHWAQELVETGWLHNHARMWFASIWIFTLRLPWELGADFFLQHLIDGDPASNTLSWRWVGGLHSRGKHYVATASNIAKFTDRRFNPRNLDEAPDPLEEPPLEPAEMPDLSGFPKLAAGSPTALLLHGEDNGYESLQMPNGVSVSHVVGLSFANHRSPSVEADYASVRWTEAALQNQLADCAAYFDAERLPMTASDDVLAELQSAGVQQIVTPYVPAGWVRDGMDAFKARARNQFDLSVAELVRGWDQRAWPYATAGFFKFKKQIPALLRDAGIVFRH
ncbi:MAG: FAD-binding domain-containing protein [Pseudomonadota bacterium]